LIPGEVIAEARSLFNEQRFWEVHEVLEGLWKKAAGSEKQLLQGIILTAAALVHAQKDETAVIFTMLNDAARRFEKQPASYYGLDVRHFTRALKKAILTKNLHFPTI
jgi:predicted metal-dependent hydrolase